MDKLNILIVDDEKHVSDCIQKGCTNHNTTVINSSLEAVEIVNKQRFDIYIIDYTLPVIDGIELLEEIQEVQKDKDYVCIFSISVGTSYIFNEELEKGLFNLFLEKPIKIDTVKKTLKSAIIRLEKIKSNNLQVISPCV